MLSILPQGRINLIVDKYLGQIMMEFPSKIESLFMRWKHHEKKRYYQVFLSRDLLGDWVLTKSWGGLTTSNGRVTHVACHSIDEAKVLIEKISRTRARRGYIEV